MSTPDTKIRVGAVVVLQTEREPRVVTSIDIGRGVITLGPAGKT